MLEHTRALRLYYLTSFAAMGIFMPYQPLWLAARGIDGWRMGAVVALRPIAMILAPVVFGMLADRFGLRGMLIRWASFGAMLSALLLGVAVHATVLGFGAIFAGFFVFSLLRVPMSTLADVASLESAGRHYGGIRLWGSIGFMLAVVCAGWWLELEEPSPYPYAIACLTMAAFVASFWVPKTGRLPPRPVLREAAGLLRRPRFHCFLALLFAWTLAHSGYDLCISLHLKALGATGAQVGLAWGLATFAEILLMARAGQAIERWGALTCVAFGIGVAAGRWLLLGSVTSLPLILLLQPLHALSFALVWVAGIVWVREEAGDGLLGSAQGMAATSMALGTALGMLAWGALHGAAGARPVFLAASGISTLALIVVGWVRRRRLVLGTGLS